MSEYKRFRVFDLSTDVCKLEKIVIASANQIAVEQCYLDILLVELSVARDDVRVCMEFVRVIVRGRRKKSLSAFRRDVSNILEAERKTKRCQAVVVDLEQSQCALDRKIDELKFLHSMVLARLASAKSALADVKR